MRFAAVVLVVWSCFGLHAGLSAAPPAPVDLAVSAVISPDPAESGGVVTYTVDLSSGGPGSALDALMVALPPQETTFLAYDGPGAADGWACTTPVVGARGKVSCLKKSLAPGVPVTFVITLKLDWCRAGSVMTSVATVSSANGDVDPGDNTATAISTVADAGLCDDRDDCTTGDHCAPGLDVSEGFDLVTAPNLPSGWTAAVVIGPFGSVSWQTSVAQASSPPNSVFARSAADLRDLVLDSPSIPILSRTAQLAFQNRYELEQDFDGAVLEISVGGGLFEDIVAAGGGFVTGGYNGTISDRYGSPINGRRAWTGDSAGFVATIVDLPPSAAGTTVVFRFRLATDLNLGRVGQWIDSVSVSGRDECRSGTQVVCDDHDVCTSDACDGLGGCLFVTTVSCDDGNACTDDPCDPTLGCTHLNNTAPCNDLDACTVSDRCLAGVCAGTNTPSCDDADVCTADSCDRSAGCVSTSANFDRAGFSAGRVDGRDLVMLAGAWSSCPGEPRYAASADLDRRDPCIEAADFHRFMDAFGRTCGS